VELRLTPQRPPRVQTLAFQLVPEPSLWLRRIVSMLVHEINRPVPHVPTLLPLTGAVDRGSLQRLLRSASAWAGACTVAEAVGGDGTAETTVRVHGDRRDLVLGVRLATAEPPAPNGEWRVGAVTLRPVADG
jgi:hypothetical protein